MKLNALFKHRSIWLGISMIVIMLYHTQLYTNSRIYYLIKQYGYAAVDVFLFASGIGCYYSLEKDPDILRFLLRRLRKLGPAYICFTVVWVLWRAMVNPLPMPAIIGSFLGLESFILWDYSFNWYISALLLFYFLMPYLKKITDSCKTLLGDFLVVVFLVIAAIPFWNPADMNMIIYSRLPIFYLGVVCAKLAKQGFTLNWMHYLLLLGGVVAGSLVLRFCFYKFPDHLWYRGLYWYPLPAMIPGLCLLMSWFGELLRKCRPLRWLYRGLELMGVYSFEIYLVHSFLYAYLMGDIIPLFPNIPYHLLWLMTIPVVAVGCILLNRAAALLLWLFDHTAKRICSML